jgi:uncharacterized protein
MSDRFVKDPLEAVKVGDVLEFRIISLDNDRRRIGLSRKSEPGPQKQTAAQAAPEPAEKSVAPKSGAAPKPGAGLREQGGGKKKVLAVKTAARTEKAPNPPRSSRDDDGTMYNPFAEAFKNMKKK